MIKVIEPDDNDHEETNSDFNYVPTDFTMGLRFFIGQLIHEYVAQKELTDGATIVIEMNKVQIEENDYDLGNIDSLNKYVDSMKVFIEM